MEDSSVSCAVPARGCRKSQEGARLGQLTPAVQKDIPHHRTPCPVYKLGELARRGRMLLREGLGMGVQLYCASFVLLGFYSSLFLFPPVSLLLSSLSLLLSLSFTIFQWSNCSSLTNFTFFSDSPPCPRGGRQGVGGCVVLSCWLELNHNTRT